MRGLLRRDVEAYSDEGRVQPQPSGQQDHDRPVGGIERHWRLIGGGAAWDDARRPWLVYRLSPGLLHIEDGRDPAKPQLYEFQSPLAEIYSAISDRPLSAANIKEALHLPWSREEIADALDLFAAKGLVMRDDDLFLALAIPAAR